MKFTVVWTAAAQQQLAKLWLDAIEKDSIQASVREIERLLASDPENAGESRVVNVRVLFASPLGIYFDVTPLDRHVKVWRVWKFGK